MFWNIQKSTFAIETSFTNWIATSYLGFLSNGTDTQFSLFESFDVESLSKTFGPTGHLYFHLFLGTLTQFTQAFLYIIPLLSGLLWAQQFMEVVQWYWKKVSVLQNFGQTLSNIRLRLVSISAKSHGFYWVSQNLAKSCQKWISI